MAVGKLKPPELILAAYEAGQRHFGENYVNELVEKGTNSKILEQCKEIKWHFIGHLQRNKVNKVLGVPNLYLIETVDNNKLATALHNAWPKYRKDENSKLKVMVQVNTSREKGMSIYISIVIFLYCICCHFAEKSGCEVEEVTSLVKHVIDDCKNLELIGIMTIGQYGYDVSNGPNPDFLCLKKCRDDVCKELGLDSKNVELSMGMSTDYEHAVTIEEY